MKRIKNLSLLFLALIFSINSKKHNLRETSDDQEEEIKEIHNVFIKSILSRALDYYLIDTRDISSSAKEYIRNSILIPLNKKFEEWLPALVEKGSKIVLICDQETYKDALNKTKNLNLYNILGYSIFQNVLDEGDMDIRKVYYQNNTRKDIDRLISKGNYLVDVREVEEYEKTGIINGINLIPLTTFKDNYNKLPDKKNIYVFCQTGVRAVMAMTFAQKKGYKNKFFIMEGGMEKTIQENYPLVKYQP